jgi:hypothetical protein
MKEITLRGSWIIRALREDVYKIISDFENMPRYFPEVAKSMRIVKRSGNNLTIHAEAKSFGTVFPVTMATELLPARGFISDNINEKLGTSGHEEFLLEDVPEGTRIDYLYRVTINRAWLQLIAKPLLGWYALWYWKRVVIDKLKNMLETRERGK